MSELDTPLRQIPDAVMLRGFWYRALPGAQVRKGELHRSTLLELPLVVGRDSQGRPFALHDACPHRGMPLSCGAFDGQQVECSYHGWRFDARSGQCQLIPSLTDGQTRDQKLRVDRIYAGSYACEERDGFIWVFIPEPGPSGAGFTKAADPLSAVPEVAKFSGKFKTAYLDRGNAGQRGPRHHRPHGPGARAVRASGVVVAQAREHPRKTEALRADCERLPHERAHPQLKQRAVQAAEVLRQGRLHHHDHRFRTAQPARGDHSRRQVLVLVIDHGDPDHAQPLPHRRGRLLEYFSPGCLSAHRC